MLSEQEKEQILSELPNIKLSYENITHKKVYSNFVLSIPEGKKCFAWFTNSKNGNVCYILELKENKQVYDIKIVNCCFNNCLSYGTIFYGTVFNHLGNNFFSIEDIFFYKGVNVSTYIWIKKLDLFEQVMNTDIKQVAYNKSFIIFGLPLISTNFDELVNQISKVNYKIKCIQFRNYSNKNVSQYLEFVNVNKTVQDITYKPSQQPSQQPPQQQQQDTIIKQVTNKRERFAVFQIKPEIQNDIYYLYCYDNITQTLVHYNIAYIPDFKTSVMMNKLFRNIKENTNLDLLEESDSEDEFENEKEDRFVYLDREFNMLCSYNYKFKKWVPLKLADKNMKIITLEKVS
jgi:hypothetical protein